MNFRMVLLLAGLRVKRVFRDRSSLIWLFAMPLFFSFMMGQVMGGSWRSDSLPSFRIYDLDAGPWADLLVEKLADNGLFRIVRIDTTGSNEMAQNAVAKRYASGAIFLAPGFSDSVEAAEGAQDLVLYYNSEWLSSNTIRTAVERELLSINMRITAQLLRRDPEADAREFDEETFMRYVDEPRISLDVESLGRKTEQLELAIERGTQHIGPAYTLMFVLMFLMYAGKDLVEERLGGTLGRLRLGRASAIDIAAGFVAGGILTGVIQLTVLLVANKFLFGIDYGPSPLCLVLVSLFFIMTSAAFGLLLGSFCRTGAQVDGIGTTATLLMAALGGLWWPLEITPAIMQKIGLALPTGMAITVFHDMIGRGWGMAENSALLAQLLLLFFVIMGLSVWRFRRLSF